MGQALNKYNYYLKSRPILTKCITSGMISGCGDLMCQGFEMSSDKTKKYNPTRTWKFFLLGSVYIAPLLHLHFTRLIPFVGGSSTGFTGFARKLAFDQLCFAPPFIFGLFHFVGQLDGKTFEQTNQELKFKYWPTMIMNWRVYSIVNSCNFLFIPMHYQVLWNNFFSMFFNAYLSYMANSYKNPTAHKH